MKFQHIGIEQGLSQDIVTAIAQDSLGFMWFGTEDGLNVYDGYTVTVLKHDPSQPTSLRANAIWSLMVDSRGRLWVANEGFAEPGARTFTRLNFPAGDVSDQTALCEADNATVLISTRKALYKYDRRGNLSPMLAGRDVWIAANAILYDQQLKRILVGSVSGLSVFSLSADTLIPQPKTVALQSIDGHSIKALFRSSDGEIFVGTLNAGLFRLSSDLERVTQYIPDKHDSHTLSDHRLFALAEDNQ